MSYTTVRTYQSFLLDFYESLYAVDFMNQQISKGGMHNFANTVTIIAVTISCGQCNTSPSIEYLHNDTVDMHTHN